MHLSTSFAQIIHTKTFDENFYSPIRIQAKDHAHTQKQETNAEQFLYVMVNYHMELENRLN